MIVSTFENTKQGKIPYENIIMPNAELPIKFFEHRHSSTGPFCILHWHNELEMVYVKEGVVLTNCGSSTIESHPGDLIFINSNEPHSYYISKGPVVLYCCTVDPVILQGRYVASFDSHLLSQTNTITVFQNDIVADKDLINMFINMWKEDEKREKGYEYAIKAFSYGIITLMVRNHTKSTITSKEYQYQNRSLNNINKALQFIHKHYSENISLNDISDYIGFNRYYFCRLFKEITGLTAIKYLNNYRIHQALSLMQSQRELTITEIASLVGFNDSNYFTRVFKNVTNETPSEYMCRIEA